MVNLKQDIYISFCTTETEFNLTKRDCEIVYGFESVLESGKISEITEEIAKKYVQQRIFNGKLLPFYRDYSSLLREFYTKEKALESLLSANYKNKNYYLIYKK